MKRFIYLDTDTLDSYIAQIFKGKIESYSESNQSNAESHNQTKKSVTPSASADFKLLGKGFDAKTQLFIEKLGSVVETSTVNKLETKALHDYAFDLLIDYVKENDLLKGENIGNFIYAKSNFYIIDLLYYKDLFNNDNFISYLIDSEINNLKEEFSNKRKKLIEDNTSQKDLNTFDREKKKILNDKKKSLDEEYENIKNIYNIITYTIPYERLLVMDDYIVILNDKFMRDNSLMTSFKYGGNINLYGYITNIIGGKTDQELPFLSETINILNTTILPFFINKDEVKIIHPIAIYY